MPDIREIFSAVSTAENELAVWRKLIEYLSKEYLSRDSHNAKSKIVLDSGAEVPEEIIQKIINSILDQHVKPTDEIVSKVLELEVPGFKKELPEDTSK